MINLFNAIKNNVLLKKINKVSVIISLFLYIFSIPAFSGRNNVFIISYIFIILLACLLFFYFLFFEKIRFDRRLFVMCFFALEALVGTALISHNFRSWLSIILMILTSFIVYFSFCVINNKRLILYIIVSAFLGFALYFLGHYFSKIITFTTLHNDSYFDNPNLIGTYFSIAFVISLYFILFFRKRYELLFIAPSLLFVVLGFYTGSRQFLFTTFFATLVLIYYRIIKHKFLFFVVIIVLFILFFILIQIPAFSFLRQQINRMLYTLFGVGNEKVDTSTIQRVLWQRYGFYLGGQHLLFGTGSGGFSIFSGIRTYAHNNYAEMVCDFGVIGLLLFYFPFIYSSILSIKNKDNICIIVIALSILYFVKGFFGVYYTFKDCYVFIALFLFFISDYKLDKNDNQTYFMDNNRTNTTFDVKI